MNDASESIIKLAAVAQKPSQCRRSPVREFKPGHLEHKQVATFCLWVENECVAEPVSTCCKGKAALACPGPSAASH
jgi:hypothetical protein